MIVTRKKTILGDLTEAQKDKNGMYSLISGQIYKVKGNHANTHRSKEALLQGEVKGYLWKGEIEEIS